MAEQCYVCTMPLKEGDPVVVLRDEEGHDWFVHAECMGEMEKAGGNEGEA